MAIYDQVYAFYKGALISEQTSVETSLESDIQRVMTLPKGFAGITPSPHIRTIKVENVVPIGGIELEIEDAFRNSEEVELQLQLGGSGQKCTSKGFIESVQISSGVGRTTTLSFSFVGEPSVFS